MRKHKPKSSAIENAPLEESFTSAKSSAIENAPLEQIFTTAKSSAIENAPLDESFTENPTESIRWSWACRIMDINGSYEVDSNDLTDIPNVGDVALFKVLSIGYHKQIMTIANKRIRLYEGDLFVGVFGNRYATDAYEGEVEGTNNLSVLTGAGMIGTVKSKYRSMGSPSDVLCLGFLRDVATQQRVNLKSLKFKKSEPSYDFRNIIVIVGSGMNSGKTTTCRKLIKAFSEKE